MDQERSWVGIAVILLGTLLIMLVPLVVGFPLVYSDTGTYLRSAFAGYVPYDRPYWYGLFVRIASLGGTSLWGVVLVQSWWCSWLLWKCWCVFGDGRGWTYLITIGVLAPLTGLGWYAGQLVPDIFTAIGLLSGLLFLLAPARVWERIAWASLILAASWVHNSNLLILPLVLAVVGLTAFLVKSPLNRSFALFGVLLLAWPGLMGINKLLTGEAYLSKFSHVFLMGHLVETGILPVWLKDHCPDERIGLCAFQDSLPENSRQFLWSDRSPLQRQGGPEAVRAEYDAIITSTLRTPKYIGMHVLGSVQITMEQLSLWRVADELEGTYYRQPYSPPYGILQNTMPQALPSFLASAQNTGEGKLGLRWIDAGYQVILALSLIGCGVLFTKRTHRVPLLVFAIGSVVIGAWVCATFSTVDSRFLARSAWLVPIIVALVWLSSFGPVRKDTNSS